jgi:hypothetical protein
MRLARIGGKLKDRSHLEDLGVFTRIIFIMDLMEIQWWGVD